jgi:hypothetical protein
MVSLAVNQFISKHRSFLTQVYRYRISQQKYIIEELIFSYYYPFDMSERLCVNCPAAEVYNKGASLKFPDGHIGFIPSDRPFIFRGCLTTEFADWRNQSVTGVNGECVLSENQLTEALSTMA